MSRHPIPLNPGFLPPATHGVLKSLLENPMKLPLHHEGEAGISRSPLTLMSCLLQVYEDCQSCCRSAVRAAGFSAL